MTAVLEAPVVVLLPVPLAVMACVICGDPSGQWTECDPCRSTSIAIDANYARKEKP